MMFSYIKPMCGWRNLCKNQNNKLLINNQIEVYFSFIENSEDIGSNIVNKGDKRISA